MFFIFGVSDGQKQLSYQSMAGCRRCGRFAELHIIVRYTYFSLFFIPLFRWNKRYFAVMSCCGAAAPLDSDIGRRIERGEQVQLDVGALDFGNGANVCPSCGHELPRDYEFCPYCGSRL